MTWEAMAFEQAAIKVERAEEFGRLQAVIEHAFLDATVEQYLTQLDRKGIRVRDLDAVLQQRVLEGFDDKGLNAQQLYQALTVSDQAQLREFYLSKLEGVSDTLRHKFRKLYQYY